MFKRKQSVANQLSTQAVPNTLSWPSVDAAKPAPESGWDTAYDFDPAKAGCPVHDEAELAEESAVLTGDEFQGERGRESRADDEADVAGSADIDPIERYGPYGEDVEDVMIALDDVQFEDITSDDLRRLEEAWKSVDAEAATAVAAVVEAFRTGGKYGEFIETAEDDVDAWLDGGSTTGRDAELDRVVVESARDAVDALILQDELEDDQFDVLYGPWADVIDPIEERGFATVSDQQAAGGEAERADAPDEGFGPNAPAVRKFLAMLAELGSDDFKELTAAFNRQPKDELQLAHNAVHDLVDGDRTQRDRVVAAQGWVTSYLRPTREMIEGPGTGLRIGRSTPTVDRHLVDKAIALPPAIDAVTALILGDLLDRDDAETLLAPWTEVMGRDQF